MSYINTYQASRSFQNSDVGHVVCDWIVRAVSVSEISDIVSMMTFQYFITSVEFHFSSTAYSRTRKNRLTKVVSMVSIMIHIDINFSKLYLPFRDFHICQGILESKLIRVTVTVRPVFSRTTVPYTPVFHESDDVCIFCDLTLNRSRIWLVSHCWRHCVRELGPRIQFRFSALCVLCVCASFRVFFSLFHRYRKSTMSHGPLCHWVIENDLSTPTPCALCHDVETCSQSSHSVFSASVRLTLLLYCHFRGQSQPRLHCGQPDAIIHLDPNTFGCFRSVFAAPSGTTQDLRMLLTCDGLLSPMSLQAVQRQSGSWFRTLDYSNWLRFRSYRLTFTNVRFVIREVTDRAHLTSQHAQARECLDSVHGTSRLLCRLKAERGSSRSCFDLGSTQTPSCVSGDSCGLNVSPCNVWLAVWPSLRGSIRLLLSVSLSWVAVQALPTVPRRSSTSRDFPLLCRTVKCCQLIHVLIRDSQHVLNRHSSFSIIFWSIATSWTPFRQSSCPTCLSMIAFLTNSFSKFPVWSHVACVDPSVRSWQSLSKFPVSIYDPWAGPSRINSFKFLALKSDPSARPARII